MDINTHPIWKGVSKYKKPLHLMRIKLAKQYAKLYSQETFIGITGSVGKTSCTAACLAVLSRKYRTIATSPNLDSIFNIPITLLKLSPKIKRVILEMGVEYKGEMDFYLSLVKPQKAILSQIYYQHSEFLGGLEEITAEKGRLFEQLPESGYAILNWDDIHSRKMAEKTSAQVVYYGTDPNNCVVWAGNIQIENFKTVFELNYGVERVQIKYNLLGSHQVYSALAAATLGIIEKIPLTQIKHGLESVLPSEHRLQLMEGANDSLILDDTYNAAPAAVEAAIYTLMQIPAKKRILVLSEMRELGEFTEKMHRQIAQVIYQQKIDMVLFGQGNTSLIANELIHLGFWEDKIMTNMQNAQIVSYLLQNLSKGDLCLIKGARAVRLDEVVKRVTKKS